MVSVKITVKGASEECNYTVTHDSIDSVEEALNLVEMFNDVCKNEDIEATVYIWRKEA
jgi:hypothetical protein